MYRLSSPPNHADTPDNPNSVSGMAQWVCMYSCSCSLSSHPIDLCTGITCECCQENGQTALMLASEGGHAETVPLLVELGASVEAVDKVNMHAHALGNTCCVKYVCGMMRMTMIIMSHVCVCVTLLERGLES
jgi:hypothetical protein